MNTAIGLCVFFFAALALARPGDEHYTNHYDHVDVDEVLNNQKLLESYIKCLLDEGKCTPEAKELKKHIDDALANGCAQCTDTQKQRTHQVMGHLINKEPEYWTRLTAKYDPDNKYATKYEKELAEITKG